MWADQKVKVTSRKNIAGMGRCTLVSAGFFHLQFLLSEKDRTALVVVSVLPSQRCLNHEALVKYFVSRI